ncbi:MAG: GNAT family N-acetyltransferase [Blastocatellia bacterium]|nr:GNAT family N-acetyltransferase [Blastocatellia bacterium]
MESQQYIIRPARLEEAALLAAAEREIARVPGRLASSPDELKDDMFRDRIALLAQHDAGLCIVLETEGEIVGHAFLEPHRLAALSHVVFLTIAIHEGHQGRGLGKKMMVHLIDWVRSHPRIEKFELQVRSSNERAIRLYQSLGFVEEGRKTRRIKYGADDYQDDVYMALWVGSFI